MKTTKVALMGAGFVADIHMESYTHFIPEAEVVAVYTRDLDKAKAFAHKWNIPRAYDNYSQLLEESDCEIVDICLPNFLHCDVTVQAAEAGKHVIVEKPLCLSLAEADRMIEACRKNGKLLMYGEQLCFAPKYERVRKLVEEGAIGNIYMLKQAEKHSGPHSAWFYNVDQSGGGVMMDMGCHAISWFLWITKNAPVKSVYAQMNTYIHHPITRGEDHVVCIVEFENGITAVCEDSWAKHGGMDDRIEIYGDGGVTYADLFMGNSALTYSRDGYGYAMEKAGDTKGWTFTVYEEVYNQGYPHELKHFVQCVRTGSQPIVTGEDGRRALEIIHAAYASAGAGKKIEMPFLSTANKPIDGWKK